MSNKSPSIDPSWVGDEVYPYNIITNIYYIVVCAAGMVLSGTIFVAISKRRWRSATIDEKLSAYMLAFDFSICVVMTIAAAINLAGLRLLEQYRHICNLDAFFTVLSYGASINLVGLISLERCLIVVFQTRLSNLFYNIIASFFVAVPIVISTIAWIWEGMGLRPMGIYCLFDVTTTIGRWITVPVIIDMALSQTFTIVGYILIALHRRRTSRKAQLELGYDPKTVEVEINRTIFRSLIIVGFNIFTVMPHSCIFLMTLIVPWEQSAPLEMVASILLTSNVITNSAILLYMKPELIKRSKAVWGF